MAKDVSEAKLLLLFSGLLAIVVAAAVFAIRSAQAPEQIALMDLPPASQAPFNRPAPDRCEEAGGTVRFERVTECFDAPDVHDACDFPGVLCFTQGDGSVCREARAPYCACMDDGDCPDAYVCEGPKGREGRCTEAPPVPIKAKPLYR